MPPSPISPSSILNMRATTALAGAVDATAKLRAFRQIVKSRVSARRFEPNCPVPDNVWRDILRMTLTSPSGFNLQPTHMLLLRSQSLKSALSRHAMLGFGNQYRTVDASAIAVFCADLEPSKRVERVFEMERDAGMREDGYMAVMRVASTFLTGEASTFGNGNGNGGGSSTVLSSFLKRTFTDALSPVQPMPTMENVESWSYKNAGIVAQMYTMAATAHGLSTCMMEGFDARRAKEILRIPDRFGIPLMVATGYDYGAAPVVHANFNGDDQSDEDDLITQQLSGGQGMQQKRTPRLEMNEIFFGDTFGEPLDILVNRDLTEKAAKVA